MKFCGVLTILIMLASSASAAKVTRERESSGKPEISKVRERNLGSGPSGKSTAAPTLNPTTSPTLVCLETKLFHTHLLIGLSSFVAFFLLCVFISHPLSRLHFHPLSHPRASPARILAKVVMEPFGKESFVRIRNWKRESLILNRSSCAARSI